MIVIKTLQKIFFAFIFLYVPALCFGDIFKKTPTINPIKHFNNQSFIESFIKHYEFNPEGRYVHEYHSFVLQKTSASLDILEEHLQTEGFCLCGRNVILGYEENAVPNYYTNFCKPKIQDEASRLNRIDWSLRLHNRFGFMTGFLFKDINKLLQQKTCFSFLHINSESIPIFDDRASIFQEHAFGDAIELIYKAEECIVNSIQDKDQRGVFSSLIKFWKIMYSSAFKSGNNQIAGTQDILFSIEYAKHLMRSNLPLFNFFTGPDITYPIEIFTKQSKEVTYNAQTFVKEFIPRLEPQNDCSTAYIFCSLVDGVGKSTMLGNIKNWIKYGDDVDQFQHVDNSSSQLAEVFKLKKNVYIADLPAQISHFTYKPDGLVFVDVLTKYSEEQIHEVQQFVIDNKNNLEEQYEFLLSKVNDIVAQYGWFFPSINDITLPSQAFIKNVLLLKKEYENKWIPFEYKNQQYLFDRDKPTLLRYLTTLGKVKSEGLKNIESEQMLFLDGVRLPLPFNLFLNDLTQKLKNQGIKNIVFVDFASMYPRSCRENIRINYLLQQLALLDEKFNVENSMYKDFVSGGELLNALQNKKVSTDIYNAFKLEVLIRLYLSQMIDRRVDGNLVGLSLEKLTDLMRERLHKNTQKTLNILNDAVNNKFCIELSSLERLYGLSKAFVNIQQLSFKNVCLYSELLQDFFTTKVLHPRINYLWQDSGILLQKKSSVQQSAQQNESQEVIVITDLGKPVRLLHEIDPLCKNELILSPAIRTIRASWYAVLANLLFTTENNGVFVVKDECFPVPPLFVTLSDNEKIQIFQKFIQQQEEKDASNINKQHIKLFNLPQNSDYGLCNQTAYRLNWNSIGTDKNVFAFSCNINKNSKKEGSFSPIITRVVQGYQNDYTVSTAMPVFDLYEQLQQEYSWKINQRSLNRQAEKNGYFSYNNKKKSQSKITNTEFSNFSYQEIFLGNFEQRVGARLLVIMLATLEMIIKDPEADIIVRMGNREDFKAAIILLEKVTLPKYFGIRFQKNLFDNYNEVEPYPSWEFWDDAS
jgi:hypothetical protein